MKFGNVNFSIVETKKNSYLYKAGFHYGISWIKKPSDDLVKRPFTMVFGEPAQKYHYTAKNGCINLKSLWPEEKRWYYGTYTWHGDNDYGGGGNVMYRPHITAFRTEQDLLLARLMLTGN